MIGSMYGSCLDQQPVLTQSVTAGVFAVCGDGIAQSIDHHHRQAKQKQPSTYFSTATADTASATTINESTASRSSSASFLNDDSYYDPTRGLHYFFKGLGSGVLWSGWYGIADAVAMQVWEPFLNNDGWWRMMMMHSSGDQEAFSLFNPHPHPNVLILRITTCIILEQILVCPIMYALWDIPVPALLRGSPLRQIPQQVQAKLPPLLWANFQVWTPVNIITYQLSPEYRVLFASMADLLWQTINSRITGQEIPIRIPQQSSSSSKAVNNNDNNDNDVNVMENDRIMEPIRIPRTIAATATYKSSAQQQQRQVRSASSTTNIGSKSLQPQQETV
jgi:hypothetical protein